MHFDQKHKTLSVVKNYFLGLPARAQNASNQIIGQITLVWETAMYYPNCPLGL